MGRVAEQPLDEVLARAKPAYYGTLWPEAVTAMMANPDDAEIVGHLVVALQRDGRFKEPVVVEDGRVGDGMHRLVASILAGAATIAVSEDWPAPAEEWIAFQFRVHGVPDPFGLVVDRLGSFPLDDVWVSSGIFSDDRGLMSATWECPHALADQLIEAVIVRLGRVGGRIEILQCRLLDDEWA